MYTDKEHRGYRVLNSPWKDHIMTHYELQIALFKTLIKSNKSRFEFPELCIGNYWCNYALYAIIYFMT